MLLSLLHLSMFSHTPWQKEQVFWQPGSELSQESAVAENNQYDFVMLVSSWSDSPVWIPMCRLKGGEEAFRGSIRLMLT